MGIGVSCFLFPISLLPLVLMDDLYGFNVPIRERLGGRGVGPGNGLGWVGWVEVGIGEGG